MTDTHFSNLKWLILATLDGSLDPTDAAQRDRVVAAGDGLMELRGIQNRMESAFRLSLKTLIELSQDDTTGKVEAAIIKVSEATP